MAHDEPVGRNRACDQGTFKVTFVKHYESNIALDPVNSQQVGRHAVTWETYKYQWVQLSTEQSLLLVPGFCSMLMGRSFQNKQSLTSIASIDMSLSTQNTKRTP